MHYVRFASSVDIMQFCRIFFKVSFIVTLAATCLSRAQVAKKTKLCGDPKCEEKLFETKLKQKYAANHESFLSYDVGDAVTIYSIRRSDRPDLIEGAIAREPARRGNVFCGHVGTEDYVQFLEAALKLNRTFFMISVEREDEASPKVVGTRASVPELIMEYWKNVDLAAFEKGQPAPPHDLATLGIKEEPHGHGHSHSGHGHSHGGHGHSHDNHGHTHDAHGHSHDAHDHSHDEHDHSHDALDHLHGAHSHSHEVPQATNQSPEPAGTSVPPPATAPASPEAHGHRPEMPNPSENAPNQVQEASKPAEAHQASQNAQTVIDTNNHPSNAENPDIQKPTQAQETINPAETLQPSQTAQSASANVQDHFHESPNIPTPTAAQLVTPPIEASQPAQESPSAEIHAHPHEHEQKDIGHVQGNAEPLGDIKESLPADRATSAEMKASEIDSKVGNVGEKTDQPPQEHHHARDIHGQSNRRDDGGRSPPNNQRSSDEGAAVRPKDGIDVIDKDGLGYCIKGDCGSVYHEPPPPERKKVDTNSSTFGKMLDNFSKMFLVESGGIDLFKALFLAVAVVLLASHLVMILFCSENEKEHIGSKMLHDALSAVRMRDQRIKELRQEADRTRELTTSGDKDKIERLEMQLGQRLTELQQYKSRINGMEEEADSLKVKVEDGRKLLEYEKEKGTKLADKVEQSEKSKQMLAEQLSEMQSNMENAREKNDLLEKELADKNALISRQGKQIESQSLEIKNVKDQLKTFLEEKRILSKRVDDLQFENAQLSELYDEMCKNANTANASPEPNKAQVEEHAAQESGGSGGWSDIGDFDIDAPEEKKEPQAQAAAVSRDVKESSTDSTSSHHTNIVEVARLRGQLERVKLKLQEEENAHSDLLRRLEIAESEAAKCRKESESKEAERIDTNSQCKKMLAMVEEKDSKIRRLDESIERLRDEKNELQMEIRKLEEQRQTLETKLNEAELELKRLRTDYDRLKKRHFHELRECRQENSALQQRLSSRQATGESLLNDSNNLLSLSGNSSDRDRTSPKGLLPGLGVPPLWSDGDTDIFSGAESSRLERGPTSSRTRPSPLDEVGQYQLQKSSRPRHREHRENSPEPAVLRPKKEGRRMRSRSHGRASAYIPPGMPFTYAPGYDPLGRRDYMSGNNLYYSSGGSNGGLSPPPVMPLLSGIPPPDAGIKKPMASTRPKSVAEQMTRHQS